MVDPSTTELDPKRSASCDFRGWCRNPIVLYALLGIVTAGLVFQHVLHAWQSIQIAFAEEQTKIFDQMVSEATAALEQSPPDFSAAVGYLEYLHNYYPSGTKQTEGSRLDKIVERCRDLAEAQIIERLRDTAETDFGSDTEKWIEIFGKKPVFRKTPNQ